MSRIDEVLTRGVADILPSSNALKELITNHKITLYQGFDPTAESLHIGHFIGVRKLAQFQKLGHKVIFLIGDFTARIGDPTDKGAARKKLTKDEVLKNLRDYKKQVEKIIKFDGANPAEVQFNSTWLSKLTFEDVIELSSIFTVQQMIERDMFQERLREGRPIYLHEFLYPMMQGYDSVVMNVDLEIGGNDQLFNMLAGRILMKAIKNKEKFVLSTKLLVDDKGKKMGKSEGNAIFLSDSPENIYGKIMTFPDGALSLAIELLTDLPLDTTLKVGPMDAKKALAFEVVRQIYGDKEAHMGREYFEKTFQNKAPEYIQEVANGRTLSETISKVAEVGSSSNAKRLIKEGAVDVNENPVTDTAFEIKEGDKIKIGKKIFVTVK